MKEKRIALGLTQAQLAEILGVRPNTVARWENGVLAVPRMAELAMAAVERDGVPKKEAGRTAKQTRR